MNRPRKNTAAVPGGRKFLKIFLLILLRRQPSTMLVFHPFQAPEFSSYPVDGLKDVLRGIDSAKDRIDALNFGMAKDHLNAAAWHVAQVKKAIALVGQAKNQKASH